MSAELPLPSDLVAHPRFGRKVRPSGHRVDPDKLRASFWQYQNEVLFPESAIPADTTRQNHGVCNRPWYVDILKACVKCGRGFLFFAEEQRFWYEDLGFFVDADCIRCPECRAAERTLRNRFNRYAKATAAPSLDDEALARHVDDA